MSFKIGLITGHGAGDSGAVNAEFGKEADFVRELAPLLKKQLEKYCDVEILDTSTNWFKYIQSGKKFNFTKYNYILELHMNSAARDLQGDGKTTGTEIFVTSAEKGTTVEQKIVEKIAAIGFRNRGVKRTNFLVIQTIKNQGISSALLETCFIDDKDDMQLFIKKKNEIAAAIASGIAEGFGLAENKQPEKPAAETYPCWKNFAGKWYFYTAKDTYTRAEQGSWKAVFHEGKKYFVRADGSLVENVTINDKGEVTEK